MYHLPLAALVLILIALCFEFINGFHDTANTVATSIATRSLEPFPAICIAAIFNLLGALSGTAVALTIIQSIANPLLVNGTVILAALLAAIIWNLLTWYLGIPSSSSHALIGSLVGAIVFHYGLMQVNWHTIGLKIVLPMLVSPVIGFLLAIFMVAALHKLFLHKYKLQQLNNRLRDIQVISTACLAFGYGTNDAQKTMGIIALILLNYHLIQHAYVPSWVVFTCALCIAGGTMLGGMRIIKTLSQRVIKLKPASGLAAELSSALVIFSSARFGIPVSTTQAISGAIMGSGSALSGKLAVNRQIVKNILVAWMITLPMCMLLAGVLSLLCNPNFATVHLLITRL